jgi:membrane protein YqaA with SNARE-associated domain
MPTWILIAAVFIPQEFASSAITLVIALQSNFPVWGIHLIWVCATFLDMYVGFMLGKFTQDRLQGTRIFRWTEKLAARTKRALGVRGEKFSFALLGVINFPCLNTFIAPWIGLPMNTALVLTFAGNFVWYVFLWATVLGLSAFISDPNMIILILVGIGILSYFFFKSSKASKG